MWARPVRLIPTPCLGKELISAVVSVAVGIILFEAGLGLNFGKLTGSVARVYRRLVTLGILVTWAVGTVAAYLLFDLSWEIALVLGAVLVVSGPTVVGPLLSFIRPSKTVNSVLKWEGTFANPIGATLGVIVFNAVVAGHAGAGGGDLPVPPQRWGGASASASLGAVLILAWVSWFRPSQSQAVTGTLMFVVAMVVWRRPAPRRHGPDNWPCDWRDPRQQAARRDRTGGGGDPNGEAKARLARSGSPLSRPS